jgi:hypothetical protein
LRASAVYYHAVCSTCSAGQHLLMLGVRRCNQCAHALFSHAAHTQCQGRTGVFVLLPPRSAHTVPGVHSRGRHCPCACVPVCPCACVPVCRCAGVPVAAGGRLASPATPQCPRRTPSWWKPPPARGSCATPCASPCRWGCCNIVSGSLHATGCVRWLHVPLRFSLFESWLWGGGLSMGVDRCAPACFPAVLNCCCRDWALLLPRLRARVCRCGCVCPVWQAWARCSRRCCRRGRPRPFDAWGWALKTRSSCGSRWVGGCHAVTRDANRVAPCVRGHSTRVQDSLSPTPETGSARPAVAVMCAG